MPGVLREGEWPVGQAGPWEVSGQKILPGMTGKKTEARPRGLSWKEQNQAGLPAASPPFPMNKT